MGKKTVEESFESISLLDEEQIELDSIFFKNKEDKLDFDNIKSSMEDETYENVDSKKLIEFLKKIEEKLAMLTNQDVARLLSALIEKGLMIEDDNDLQYWINRLENEAMMRLLDYLNTFYLTNTDKNGNVRFEKHKKRHAKKAKEYDLKDVDALVCMISSIKNVERKRNPLSREYDESSKEQIAEHQKFLKLEKYYSEIERVLKQDLVEKRFEEANKNNENSNDNSNNQQPDYARMLKNKMEQGNVQAGGEYYGNVMSDFGSSGDKEAFVKNFSVDSGRVSAEFAKSQEASDKAKIESLRGTDKTSEKSASQEAKTSNQNNQSNQNTNSSSSAGKSGGASSGGRSGGGSSGGR